VSKDNDRAVELAIERLEKIFVLATNRQWETKELKPLSEVLDQLYGRCNPRLQLRSLT